MLPRQSATTTNGPNPGPNRGSPLVRRGTNRGSESIQTPIRAPLADNPPPDSVILPQVGPSSHGWVDLDVVVDCSSGTYIRALARDLGEDLGVGGHLTALRRTRIGRFSVADAVGLDDIAPDKILPMAQVASLVAEPVQVAGESVADISVGRSIPARFSGDLAAVLYGDTLLGLYRPDPDADGMARPVAVFIEPGDCAGIVGDVIGGVIKDGNL